MSRAEYAAGMDELAQLRLLAIPGPVTPGPAEDLRRLVLVPIHAPPVALREAIGRVARAVLSRVLRPAHEPGSRRAAGTSPVRRFNPDPRMGPIRKGREIMSQVLRPDAFQVKLDGKWS
jgi:hypothetical protein